jgi:hypothetical protein
VGLWPGGQVGLVARWPGCALARGGAGALGALVHKYLHCFVFICGRQASGRWIDVAIPRLRINWEFLLRLSEMWYFRPQQSLRRTDNTSVLSSGTHEKAALSGRLADRLRLPVASCLSWAGRRSQGTLGVQLYTAWPRQVFSGQQSPTHIPPFSLLPEARGPGAHVQKIHVSMCPCVHVSEISAVAVAVAEFTSLLQVSRAGGPPGPCFPPQEARCTRREA